MPSSAADAIAASTVAALQEHAPFDEMDAQSLRFIADHAALAYYARSTVIVGPNSGEIDRLFIIKQGQVRGSGTLSREPSADVHFGAGECFPVGALIGRRTTVYEYRAESDVFCWELRAEHFRSLLERSRTFQIFCTDYLAALVDRAHRAQQAHAAGALSDHAGML